MYIYWPHEKFMANVVPMSESVAKLKEEKAEEGRNGPLALPLAAICKSGRE